MSITVAKLMKTHVIVLGPDESLNVGMARMTESGVRHLPIVDREGHLVGLVSRPDLVRAIDVMRTAEGKRQPLKLRDVMITHVYRATPELPAHQAAAMMIEHKIGMLPVVDEGGHVVGVVTDTDFLEVARETLLGVEPTHRAQA
jgi:CBS domain-containing protein